MGDYIFGVRIPQEILWKIHATSTSPKALALNLLDKLVSKEIQEASNITGKNGKLKLDENILNAIKCKFNFLRWLSIYLPLRDVFHFSMK